MSLSLSTAVAVTYASRTLRFATTDFAGQGVLTSCHPEPQCGGVVKAKGMKAALSLSRSWERDYTDALGWCVDHSHFGIIEVLPV